MELLAKIREIRSEKAGTDKRDNAKQPIYERSDLAKIQKRIDKTLDPSFSLWWRVSIATGWRTNDVCRLTFSDIDFASGTATITVSKQTKAAEARAFSKTLKQAKESLKKQAALAGDFDTYMAIDQLHYKQLLESDLVTIQQKQEIEAKATEAVQSAPVKRDTKALPSAVLKEISERMGKNTYDDFVFSRRLMKANAIKNMDGHLSRVGVWKALKAVFAWFAETVGAKLKLSAYSARKTFAYLMLRGKSGSEQNLTEVMQAFGHSSIQMTMRYLGLESRSETMQRDMVTDWQFG